MCNNGGGDQIQGPQRKLLARRRLQPHREHQDEAQIAQEHYGENDTQRLPADCRKHRAEPFRHSRSQSDMFLYLRYLQACRRAPEAGRRVPSAEKGLHTESQAQRLQEPASDHLHAHIPAERKADDEGGSEAENHCDGRVGQPRAQDPIQEIQRQAQRGGLQTAGNLRRTMLPAGREDGGNQHPLRQVTSGTQADPQANYNNIVKSLIIVSFRLVI